MNNELNDNVEKTICRYTFIAFIRHIIKFNV
jgi:hypothetical protein